MTITQQYQALKSQYPNHIIFVEDTDGSFYTLDSICQFFDPPHVFDLNALDPTIAHLVTQGHTVAVAQRVKPQSSLDRREARERIPR